MLNLTVKDTDSNDVSAEITIDDQNTILNNGKILLSPGNHSITIHNDNYRNETHSIIIEQAKITDIITPPAAKKPSKFLWQNKIYAAQNTQGNGRNIANSFCPFQEIGNDRRHKQHIKHHGATQNRCIGYNGFAPEGNAVCTIRQVCAGEQNYDAE